MTTTTPTPIPATRTVHSVDLGVARLLGAVLAFLVLVAGVTTTSAARALTATQAHQRSVVVVGSLLCVPVAVVGLVGVWWAVLACCPTGLLIEAMRDTTDN